MRGKDYAWANSLRLQATLREAAIGYEHRRDLAPTTGMRQLQYREDKRLGVGKRSRVELADAYRDRYTAEVLDHVELASIVESLPIDRVSALMCVERDPEACHRSLIAGRMAEKYAILPIHLRPNGACGAVAATATQDLLSRGG